MKRPVSSKVKRQSWQMNLFPVELRQRLKIYAIMNNITLTATVVKFVEHALKDAAVQQQIGDSYDRDCEMTQFHICEFPSNVKATFVNFCKKKGWLIYVTLIEVCSICLEQEESHAK